MKSKAKANSKWVTFLAEFRDSKIELGLLIAVDLFLGADLAFSILDYMLTGNERGNY